MPDLFGAADACWISEDTYWLLYEVPGMLIPMGVFIALVEELRAGDPGTMIAATPDAHDLQRRLNCPHCHHRMDTHFYNGPGNVIIDDCDNCELNWLDHGELMRIVRAPDCSNHKAQESQ